MFVSPDIVRVFSLLYLRTFTIMTIFGQVLIQLTIFQLYIILTICLKKLVLWYLDPFSQCLFFSLLFFFKWSFFLKHCATNGASSEVYFNEIIFPTIFKQILKLLLQIFKHFFCTFSLGWRQNNHQRLLHIILAWFFKGSEHFDWRWSQLSIVEKGDKRMKVEAKVERVFDFITNVGRLVVWDETSKSIFDEVSSLSSPTFIKSISLDCFDFCLGHLFFKMPLLKLLPKNSYWNQIGGKSIIWRFFPCFSPRVNINRHRNERLQNGPWPFFVLCKDNNDQTEFISLMIKRGLWKL